mgnify:FL=1
MIGIYVFIRKKWEHLDYLLVVLTILSSYVFWQLSAPLIRYGYAYTLLLIVLVFGFVKQHIGFDKIVYYGIIIIGIIKFILLLKYAYGYFYAGNYIWQKDYGKYETIEYEIDGVTFYRPVGGDQVGYDAFPASPYEMDLEFIGDEIKDGFY